MHMKRNMPHANVFTSILNYRMHPLCSKYKLAGCIYAKCKANHINPGSCQEIWWMRLSSFYQVTGQLELFKFENMQAANIGTYKYWEYYGDLVALDDQ